MLVLRHRMHLVLAALTIMLAAGANTAVFSVINSLWIRQPTVKDVDHLVVIGLTRLKVQWVWTDLGLGIFRDTGLFDQLAGQATATDANGLDLQPHVVIEAIGHEVEALAVTPNYFSTLGVRVVGRDFVTEQAASGAPAVGIISDRLWRTEFGRRSDVLGSTVRATPEPITIIGIAPPGFHGALRGQDVDLWIPHALLHRFAGVDVARQQVSMIAIGRLRSGVTVTSAQAWFARSTDRRFFRDTVVMPLGRLFGSVGAPAVAIAEGRFITVVALTALLVLASGCGTCMALLLVHYERRRQEIAVRMALGASRARILQLLARELSAPALVSVVGTLVMTHGTLRLLQQFRLPSGLDFGRLDLSADWRVYLVATVACLGILLGAALVPISRIMSSAGSGEMRPSQAARLSSSLHLRRLVLALHAAMATILIATAGLFVQSVRYGQSEAPGFDTERVVFASVRMKLRPSQGGAQELAGDAAASARLFDALRSLPGVEAVATGASPLSADAEVSLTVPQSIRSGTTQIDVPVVWIHAGPGYVETIGTPLLLGRGGDGQEAVVTRTLAEQLWPGQSPLGQPIRYGPFDGTVVGVADLAFGSLKLGRPSAIVTFNQPDPPALVLAGMREISVAIRVSHPQVRGRIARTLRDLFPDAVEVRVVTGRDIVDLDLGRERLASWLFSVSGLIASLLGIGGVFGLVAYAVSSDRRAYGIMMAIGASPGAIMRTAIWRGLGPVVVGVAGGIPAAIAVANVLNAQFVGIRPSSPAAYMSTVSAFLVCAVAASVWAARRIRHITPVEVLRSE
jgi:putative ABC transport system permease protein